MADYDPFMAQSEIASSPPSESPLSEALTRVGDRWTLLVVEALLNGPQRFNDLLGQLPGIAANILSDRLKRLERDGLLVARPYSERPPRNEYHLTEKGLDLWPVLHALLRYGDRWYAPDGPPRRILHRSCGGEADDRRICTRCGAHLKVTDVVPVPPSAAARAA